MNTLAGVITLLLVQWALLYLDVYKRQGLERMYGEKQENVYYYITTLNENYHLSLIHIFYGGTVRHKGL